jgi:hypothetical protein
LVIGNKIKKLNKISDMKIILLSILFVPLFNTILFGEEVYLKNGDRITGTILSYTQEELILKTSFGVLTIKRDDVVSIKMETEKDTPVETKSPLELEKEQPEVEEKTLKKDEGIKTEEIIPIENPLLLPKPPSPKSTTSAVMFNIIPGGGYFYLGKTGKGFLTFVGETGLAIWGGMLVNEDKKNIGIPLLIGVGLLRIIDFTDVIEEAKATQNSGSNLKN